MSCESALDWKIFDYSKFKLFYRSCFSAYKIMAKLFCDHPKVSVPTVVSEEHKWISQERTILIHNKKTSMAKYQFHISV